MTASCYSPYDIIYKGTTPTFNFNMKCVDVGTINLAETHIIFVSGTGMIDKVGDDIKITDNTLSCELTQGDTTMFMSNVINIQILVTFKDGAKAASVIKTIPTSAVLGGDVW